MIKLPLIGSYLSFFLNPIRFFESVFKQQGNVAVIDFGILGKSYYLFDPDDIELFFSVGQRLHRKQLNQMFGNGLFALATGEQALKQRHALKQCLNTSTLEHMIAIIDQQAQQFFLECSQYPAGIALTENIKPFVRKLQLVLVMGALSTEEEEAFLQHLDVVLCYLNREFTTLIKIPYHWPTPANYRFRKSLAKLRSLIETKVNSCLSTHHEIPPTDILSSLVAMFRANKEDAETGFSTSLICDEVLALLIAGTETSAAIVIWMLHLLAGSPEVQHSLKTEVQPLASNRGIQLQDLPKLPFSRYIVQETLRLYPPAWAMIRQLAAPLKLKTCEIPADSTVWAIAHITHRHPDLWDNPENFCPERFAMKHHQARPKFAFYPFGGGEHRCIAERFVLTQAQIIALVAGRYCELKAVTAAKLNPKAGIALLPTSSPHVIFKFEKVEKI